MAPLCTMAESTGRPGPPAGWDGLLATKLHRPRPSVGFVPRPRLVDRLERSVAEQLVLVSAPAGFGKTSLLADWAGQSRWPVAWLSLDRGDDDPARFWRHLTAALDRVRSGLVEQLGPLLTPAQSYEGLAAALINRLAARPDQVRVVLDDYHLVESRQVHESIAFLLEHRPPALRFVLASRSDPPLPLARLRAHGQLAELRATDLRFTAEEATALMRAGVPGDLPDGAVSALTTRTEGWAAGLQLAALSLQGQPDVAGFVATFSGSHRYVLDFLAEEVLERQPARLRQFLLETSVLERLSGELCDAVTGRTGGQETLERVERANLFLVPLDAARRWWRYHHLFADLLRVRLRQEQPDRVTLLHHRAAAWSEAHGLADDAVRHALAAGDHGWAGRLVERHLDGLLLRSERVTLAGWLAALPVELVATRPRLLLGQTLFSLVSGEVDMALGPLDAAERAAANAADEPYEPSVGRAASLVANVPATIALARAFQAELRGDPDAEITFGRRALTGIGEGELTLRAITRAHLGVAEWLRGHLRAAERTLAQSSRELIAAGQRFLAVRICEHLSQVRLAHGDLDAAVAGYRQAMDIAAPPDQTVLPAAGIADVGLAEVAYQRNRLDAALEHVTRGIGPCRQLVYSQPLTTGLATLARIRQATGTPPVPWTPSRRPGAVRPARTWPACSTRSPCCWRGSSWPRAMSPRPPDGPATAASIPTTSPAIPRSRSTWCWPGCCWPRSDPPRLVPSSIDCAPPRWPRTGRAASSRSMRCVPWRWRTAGIGPRRCPPWPRRSNSATGRGASACLSTRGPRCARCSPTSWRPGEPTPTVLGTCRSTTSAGWSGRSNRTPRPHSAWSSRSVDGRWRCCAY